MQCPFLKFIPVLFLLSFLTGVAAYSQISTHRLQQADSLFNAKQFTQSLDHYKEILKQHQYTPAMLLKMAFVEEGLSHIGESLYYLNLYFLATADESVLDKMEQLSKKHKLQGYKISESEQVLLFYRRYHHTISLALAAVLLFLFSLAVFLKRRAHKPVAILVTVLILAGIFGAHLVAKESNAKIIVAGENNYIMEGPSGAAPVVDIIHGGHRFEIEKRYDIWVQIRWKGKTAFIRESQVLPVHL